MNILKLALLISVALPLYANSENISLNHREFSGTSAEDNNLAGRVVLCRQGGPGASESEYLSYYSQCQSVCPNTCASLGYPAVYVDGKLNNGYYRINCECVTSPVVEVEQLINSVSSDLSAGNSACTSNCVAALQACTSRNVPAHLLKYCYQNYSFCLKNCR